MFYKAEMLVAENSDVSQSKKLDSNQDFCDIYWLKYFPNTQKNPVASFKMRIIKILIS